jgi:hypothetical protein
MTPTELRIEELNNQIDWDAFKRQVDEIKIKNNFPLDTTCFVCIKCEKIVKFDEAGHGYCDCFYERTLP